MRRQTALVYVFLIIISFTVLKFNFQVQAANNSPQIQPPEVERKEGEKIGAILDLPAESTQLEIGKEVYRLVCSACHAYDGSGLTDEWRATWNPKDQNCWQSKCHGYNHPVDGFYLPNSPAIVGSFFPYLFPTALDLKDYISREMPWHDRGVLPEDQTWAVTAYTIFLNGYELDGELNAETAANYRLEIKEEQSTNSTVTETALPVQENTTVSAVTVNSPPTIETMPNPLDQPQPAPVWVFWGVGLLATSGLVWVLIRKKPE